MFFDPNSVEATLDSFGETQSTIPSCSSPSLSENSTSSVTPTKKNDDIRESSPVLLSTQITDEDQIDHQPVIDEKQKGGVKRKRTKKRNELSHEQLVDLTTFIQETVNSDDKTKKPSSKSNECISSYTKFVQVLDENQKDRLEAILQFDVEMSLSPSEREKCLINDLSASMKSADLDIFEILQWFHQSLFRPRKPKVSTGNVQEEYQSSEQIGQDELSTSSDNAEKSKQIVPDGLSALAEKSELYYFSIRYKVQKEDVVKQLERPLSIDDIMHNLGIENSSYFRSTAEDEIEKIRRELHISLPEFCSASRLSNLLGLLRTNLSNEVQKKLYLKELYGFITDNDDLPLDEVSRPISNLLMMSKKGVSIPDVMIEIEKVETYLQNLLEKDKKKEFKEKQDMYMRYISSLPFSHENSAWLGKQLSTASAV